MLVAICAVALVVTTQIAVADTGVGVDLASIDLNSKLSPGGSYSLPKLGVLNTGSDAGDYKIDVTYLQDQKEKRPPSDWFDFEPKQFHLDRGASRNVAIQLTLPSHAEPGTYFAYIEAHPKTGTDGVSVSVAAATKLSFTVKPSSWLAAQRLRFNRFLDDNQPWTWLLPALAFGAILVWAGRRYSPVRLRSPFERK
ncbi:MAG TPA: hypothetical protein VFY10_09290 [Dehalococcoidia bacterium]|nr:hypothetical protein [Dehalococcoidia bacterium]